MSSKFKAAVLATVVLLSSTIALSRVYAGHCTDGAGVCLARSGTIAVPGFCTLSPQPCTVTPGFPNTTSCKCQNNPEFNQGHMCLCIGS